MSPQIMEPEKDLRYYWRALLARKHYFIWPALAIMATSPLVALLLPAIYESKSTILIESQQIPPEFVRSTVTGYADQRIQSLNQQILSRTRLWRSSSSLTCMAICATTGTPRR